MKLNSLAFLVCFFVATYFRIVQSGEVNGGVKCAACTIIVGLFEQLMVVHNTTAEDTIAAFCGYLPSGVLSYTCNQAIKTFGTSIINGIKLNESPDVICNTMEFCRVDPGEGVCRLFKKSELTPYTFKQEIEAFKYELKQLNVELRTVKKSICDEPVFGAICTLFKKAFGTNKPLLDFDGDGYSVIQGFRGSSWRGKDCNDFSSRIHPGAKAINGDVIQDGNCNGIRGKDKATGQSYEDLYCKDSKPMGIAVLGDSVSARFRVPDQWFDASQLSSQSLSNLLFAIENELDWPQFSASTGHRQSDLPIVKGKTNSLYLKLLERNRCNFRLSRNQTNDNPLIVLYSLVGNDVCNEEKDTFSNMTSLQAMQDNLLQTMQYLDTILPKGSHLFLTGLANGSVLYDLLKDRIHPLGRLRNDVTYTDVYDYLGCLQLSPCNGWLSKNSTLRDLTTTHAQQLSLVIKNFTETYKFNNFDMGFFNFPLADIFAKWKSMGGEEWQLIEPVDGFHVTQDAHTIVADFMWEFMEKNHPDWLGPINPYNDLIKEKFGDQGGY